MANLARDLWRRITRRSTAPNVQSLINRPAVSGVPVTPDTALTISAAFSCINTIATDTAMLPLEIVQVLPDKTIIPKPEDPRNELLQWSPDGDATSMRQRQAIMGHTLSWGNGYIEIIRDTNTGMPIRFVGLSPQPWITKARRHDNGTLLYDTDGGKRSILADNVIHVAGLGWDGISGYSVVAMMREAFGLAKATELFGAAFFGNGSLPSGFIKLKDTIGTEAAANLRESIERMHQGAANAWRLAVLEEGAEWEQITMPMEDAQFLATRQFQLLDIARAFRVPPNKIGDYSQAHHTNVEQANQDYITTCLMGWLVATEQAYALKIFTKPERLAGYRVRHDVTALMRGDSAARSELWTKLFAVGAVSPNEIANREGFGSLPGGDQRFVPLNFVPLSQAGRPDKDVLTRSQPE